MIHFNTSKEELDRIINSIPNDTAIGEFSGRDSVAAIIKALEERPDINDVLPVATFAGTEYGNVDDLFHNHEKLVERIRDMFGDEKRIHPLVVHSNVELWSAINGRFVSKLIEKFGFYNPCIGCHAYLHIVRIPMAKRLGSKIIAGERELHERKIKVNQLPQCLNTYRNILDYFDVELVEPLRRVLSGEEIEKIIGWEWRESAMHPSCVYSGNYRDIDGKAMFDPHQLAKFLDEFIYPASVELTRLLLNDENAGKEEMIKIVEAMI